MGHCVSFGRMPLRRNISSCCCCIFRTERTVLYSTVHAQSFLVCASHDNCLSPPTALSRLAVSTTLLCAVGAMNRRTELSSMISQKQSSFGGQFVRTDVSRSGSHVEENELQCQGRCVDSESWRQNVRQHMDPREISSSILPDAGMRTRYSIQHCMYCQQ